MNSTHSHHFFIDEKGSGTAQQHRDSINSLDSIDEKVRKGNFNRKSSMTTKTKEASLLET
jgi:hypothetical protein